MDWDKLRIFYIVANSGSLTRAAEKLNASQSSVSRQINVLEESLATPLFYRHARGLLLTEQGETLFKAAREAFSKLALTEALLLDQQNRHAGEIKINSLLGFGSLWLAPKIDEFLKQYPEVDLTLELNDELVDLEIREADVAVRGEKVPNQGISNRFIGAAPLSFYASHAYLEQYGTPQTLEDLDRHHLIGFYQPLPGPTTLVNWHLSAGAKDSVARVPHFAANSLFGMGVAVDNGIGIALLARYGIGDFKNIVHILKDTKPPKLELYFSCAKEREESPLIKKLYEHLTSYIKDGVM